MGNTNGSVGSSNSSHSNPRDQNSREERLETHLEAEQSEDEDEFIDNDFKGGSRRNGGQKKTLTHGTSNHSCLKRRDYYEAIVDYDVRSAKKAADVLQLFFIPGDISKA